MEFIDIKGFNGLYQINPHGVIKNNRGMVLKQSLNPHGYFKINLSLNKKKKCCLIHRLLADSFIENKNNYKIINHINGIKTDNRLINLEWCSVAHNNKHAYDIGLRISLKGELHPLYKTKISNIGKEVLCLKTGIFYSSINECAKAKCINKTTLAHHLSGRIKNTSNVILI
jgi:hypothetical protein